MKSYKPKKDIALSDRCPDCRGSGSVPKMTMPWIWLPKKCPECNGTGKKEVLK